MLQFFKSIGETLDMFYNFEFDEGNRRLLQMHARTHARTHTHTHTHVVLMWSLPVNTDDNGHISFHDEAIKARKSGFYYRAPVAHEWHFDEVREISLCCAVFLTGAHS